MPDIRGRRSVLAVALAILTVGALAVAGSPAGAKAGGAATIKVRKTSLGKVLVDAKGRTVYLFDKDRRGGSSSTCSGACAKAWPPVMTSGAPQAGKGARKSLLGTIRRSGGRQVTYNGWPLYRFIQDKKPGDTKGQDIDAFGAEWYALSAGGDKID